MPITLSSGQIKITKGDTLWGIYGSNWRQLSGYTGDPTKLQIGTILPAPSTPTPIIPTTPIVPPIVPPVGGETPESLGLLPPKTQEELDLEAAQKARLAMYPQAEPSEEDIRTKVMAGFQSEIDALERIYAEKKAEITRQYTRRGEERLGSQAAIMGRAGMLGQVSGEAAAATLGELGIQELRGAQSLVEAEKSQAISALMGESRKMSTAEYERKLAAYTAGADATIEYLKGRVERKQESVKELVRRAIISGIDLNTVAMVKDYATTLGVSPELIVSTYKEAKKAQDIAEAEKTKKAAKEAAELEKTKAETTKLGIPPTIGNTEIGFWQYNPETGRYDIQTVKGLGREPSKPPTSYQEWELAGGLKTGKTYAEWLEMAKKKKPWAEATATEKSKVLQWIYKQPGYTEDDVKRLETDPEFFYWVLDKSIGF